jgi:hypothetical protein
MNEMTGLKRSLHLYEDKYGIRKLEEDLIKQKEQAAKSKLKYRQKTEVMLKRIEEVERRESLEKEKNRDLNNSVDYNRSTSLKKVTTNDLNNKSLEKTDVKSNNNNLNKDKKDYKSDVPLNNNKFSNNDLNSSLNAKTSKKSIVNDKQDKIDNLNKDKNPSQKLKLFTDTERSELENILPSKTIDIYENRFSAICHAKEAEEKRHLTSIKLITKKVKDIEERIEMNFFIIKEAEQKGAISCLQIEELKQENTKLTEKIQVAIHEMNKVKQEISEIEIENKSYINKMQEMKIEFEKDLDAILNPPPEKNEAEEEENEDREDDDDN